jgi:hypothetical protein
LTCSVKSEKIVEESVINEGEMDDPKKNIIRRIAPQQPESKPCPKCNKPNPVDELYCYSCGTILIQTGGTQKIGAPDANDAFFGEGMVLYIQVRGAQQVMRVLPRAEEMVIGRRSPDNVMLPDIDLSPYNGETMGVSRMHAGLKYQNDTLVLTDMGSLNHTHINGQRLHAHEVRVLHDGDELRFGQLAMRIYFRRE